MQNTNFTELCIFFFLRYEPEDIINSFLRDRTHFLKNNYAHLLFRTPLYNPNFYINFVILLIICLFS